jgi:ribosomal protein L37AE/L43A
MLSGCFQDLRHTKVYARRTRHLFKLGAVGIWFCQEHQKASICQKNTTTRQGRGFWHCLDVPQLTKAYASFWHMF